VAKLRDEVERWRTTAEERGMALAKAEGENTVLRELVDELKAQLAEARRPWWRRLLG
jgi:hypothetical protein